MKRVVEHLLKEGSYLITLCGIDSEYIDGLVAHVKLNGSVDCKRCIDSYRASHKSSLVRKVGGARPTGDRQEDT